MEWVALVLALTAVILLCVHALQARPAHFGWLGLAALTVSLAIWHTVAALEPVFNRP